MNSPRQLSGEQKLGAEYFAKKYPTSQNNLTNEDIRNLLLNKARFDYADFQAVRAHWCRRQRGTH